MKKVLVEWYDSYSTDPWMKEEDARELFEELLLVTSVGMLLHQNDKCIVLCHSYDGVNVCGLLNVPKASIIKITELRNK